MVLGKAYGTTDCLPFVSLFYDHISFVIAGEMLVAFMKLKPVWVELHSKQKAVRNEQEWATTCILFLNSIYEINQTMTQNYCSLLGDLQSDGGEGSVVRETILVWEHLC